MRTFALALAAAAALLAGPALEARASLTPDQQLAKLLEGRMPGKPSSCITSWDSRDMVVLDRTALVYGSGRTIWVNRPDNAEQLNSNDILVEHLTGSELCRLDIVHTVDRGAYFPTGFISLGDFVPYTRVPAAAPHG